MLGGILGVVPGGMLALPLFLLPFDYSWKNKVDKYTPARLADALEHHPRRIEDLPSRSDEKEL